MCLLECRRTRAHGGAGLAELLQPSWRLWALQERILHVQQAHGLLSETTAGCLAWKTSEEIHTLAWWRAWVSGNEELGFKGRRATDV